MAKILLVEDETVLREAFSIILKSNNYDFDTATNGIEALDCCKDQVYDLILLDLMMPKLDGVGFLKQANLREIAPKTRIIVLSNLSSGESLNEAVSLGAHHSEVKANLDPSGLIKLVKEELALQR